MSVTHSHAEGSPGPSYSQNGERRTRLGFADSCCGQQIINSFGAVNTFAVPARSEIVLPQVSVRETRAAA